jgi:hypothetical protein
MAVAIHHCDLVICRLLCLALSDNLKAFVDVESDEGLLEAQLQQVIRNATEFEGLFESFQSEYIQKIFKHWNRLIGYVNSNKPVGPAAEVGNDPDAPQVVTLIDAVASLEPHTERIRTCLGSIKIVCSNNALKHGDTKVHDKINRMDEMLQAKSAHSESMPVIQQVIIYNKGKTSAGKETFLNHDFHGDDTYDYVNGAKPRSAVDVSVLVNHIFRWPYDSGIGEMFFDTFYLREVSEVVAALHNEMHLNAIAAVSPKQLEAQQLRDRFGQVSKYPARELATYLLWESKPSAPKPGAKTSVAKATQQLGKLRDLEFSKISRVVNSLFAVGGEQVFALHGFQIGVDCKQVNGSTATGLVGFYGAIESVLLILAACYEVIFKPGVEMSCMQSSNALPARLIKTLRDTIHEAEIRHGSESVKSADMQGYSLTLDVAYCSTWLTAVRAIHVALQDHLFQMWCQLLNLKVKALMDPSICPRVELHLTAQKCDLPALTDLCCQPGKSAAVGKHSLDLDNIITSVDMLYKKLETGIAIEKNPSLKAQLREAKNAVIYGKSMVSIIAGLEHVKHNKGLANEKSGALLVLQNNRNMEGARIPRALRHILQNQAGVEPDFSDAEVEAVPIEDALNIELDAATPTGELVAFEGDVAKAAPDALKPQSKAAGTPRASRGRGVGVGSIRAGRAPAAAAKAFAARPAQALALNQT